jgi:hypothetical protein
VGLPSSSEECVELKKLLSYVEELRWTIAYDGLSGKQPNAPSNLPQLGESMTCIKSLELQEISSPRWLSCWMPYMSQLESLTTTLLPLFELLVSQQMSERTFPNVKILAISTRNLPSFANLNFCNRLNQMFPNLHALTLPATFFGIENGDQLNLESLIHFCGQAALIMPEKLSSLENLLVAVPIEDGRAELVLPLFSYWLSINRRFEDAEIAAWLLEIDLSNTASAFCWLLFT